MLIGSILNPQIATKPKSTAPEQSQKPDETDKVEKGAKEPKSAGPATQTQPAEPTQVKPVEPSSKASAQSVVEARSEPIAISPASEKPEATGSEQAARAAAEAYRETSKMTAILEKASEVEEGASVGLQSEGANSSANFAAENTN